MVDRVITKNLAGVEDLLFGKGTVNQTRSGDVYPVEKISMVWACSTFAELEQLDTEKFTTASLYGVLYEYKNGSWQTASIPTISALRLLEPTKAGQIVEIDSYYGGWAAVVGGEPKYGGKFWHDALDDTTVDDGFKCIVTAGGKRWKRVKGQYSIGHAGAVEDKNVDSTTQIQLAINGTKAGQELQFVGGPYKFDQIELTKPIVLTGDAELYHNGFRIKTSDVHSDLRGWQHCSQYASSSRGFHCWAYADGLDYSNILITYNKFEGFFYSTDLRGREYSATPSDPANKVLKGTTIIGCISKAPAGLAAGHFQHTGVTNAKTIACSSYGGINATSYNFINGNGFIIVSDCYDENNTYGSLEIENNQLSYGVVSGNVFGKQLWIDDTSNITITGNTVADRILITAQSNDTDNLLVSSNNCTRISITKFGVDPVGRHKSVKLIGNVCYGQGGANDIFADDSVDRLIAESNSLNGVDSSAIAVVRSANSYHLLRNNDSSLSRPLTVSGSGGTLIEYGNIGMTLNGSSNSKHVSNLLKVYKDYLDLPGKYLHGTKYTGSIAPLGTANIALPIPDGGSLSFRALALWVLVRDTGSNNISSYRVDGLHKVVGAAVALTFGTAYSAQGVDSTAITVANNASTGTSINILFTNTSGSKTLQVTVMPEVSSRLGTEE